MKNDVSDPRHRERGFSLIELLVVASIIAIMAAVALPNIGGYIRNYKIKGAAQEVGGEITAARSKAIMTNTNDGVFFVIVDRDSYRYVLADNPDGEQLGPLRDLPGGVQFVVDAGDDSGPSLRFSRMGQSCNPVATPATCAPSGIVACSTEEEASARCSSTPAKYVAPDAGAAGDTIVTLIEASTTIQRTVRVAAGGRVLPQP